MNLNFILLIILLLLTSCQPSDPNAIAFQETLKEHGTKYDFWIRNGLVYNGLDTAGVKMDVLIKGEDITFVGPVDGDLITVQKEIDATGQVVAPGFIDTHAHGDPLRTPAFENFLSMGVTTICLGQDGFSPMRENIGEWMESVADTIPGTNIAMFIGHSTLRQLSGTAYEPEPKPMQLDTMKALLARAMDAGCFGMTTGLEYTPGTYASDPELLALAKIVGEQDGLIMSHVRNEDNEAVEASIQELLRQGQYCNVHVSHLKVVYGKGEERAEEILALLQSAETGHRVTADIYPYNASYTGIGIVFPQWAKAPNDYNQVKRTRREELLAFLRQKVTSRNGPEATLLGTGDFAGKTLADVSQERGAPFEEVLEEIGPEGASGAYFVMNDSLQQRLIAAPDVMICSDGSPTMRHPRGYGTFAKIIEEYVQNRQLFPLGTAIHKMSGLSAQTIGLENRGVLKAGNKADVVIFDPTKVRANATYENPHQLATGFDWVLVNGQLAINNGQLAEERFGEMLRK